MKPRAGWRSRGRHSRTVASGGRGILAPTGLQSFASPGPMSLPRSES